MIQTSSAAHRLFGQIDLDDLDNAKGWSANKAYGDGKLANVLFTRELHRRFHDQGINAVAFHPGVIRTNFANDTPSLMRLRLSHAAGATPDRRGVRRWAPHLARRRNAR